MKQQLRTQLLESMGNIYKNSKDSKLTEDFLKTIDKDLDFLAQYFAVTRDQAFVLGFVFCFNTERGSINVSEFIDHFACRLVDCVRYVDEFDCLFNARLLKKETRGRHHRFRLASYEYELNDKVSDAIMAGDEMPTLKEEKIDDVLVLIEKLYALSDGRDEELISSEDILSEARSLFEANKHFPLIERLAMLRFGFDVIYLLMVVMWDTVTGSKSSDISRTLKDIYDGTHQRIRITQNILCGSHPLFKNGFLKVEEAAFFNDAGMMLDDKAKDLLYESGIELLGKGKTPDNVIKPDAIPERRLIFNEKEMSQLVLLQNLLQDSKLTDVQKRLSDKGMAKGVNVLLHGAPGTGKTESVKQIAKATNREIMKVEISQSKSKWYGDSEKIIKKIFTDYAAYAKGCERMPILLFNEADAVISKRGSNSESNVSKTENTIQNILLEEFENFEGILIATTNLPKNLDSAFERRFLFKIEFAKPDMQVKSEIWQIKLPHLSKEECLQLGAQYDFSGGQIDNIVRKQEIYEILHGEKVAFLQLVDYCGEESFEKSRTRVGFA